MARNAKATVDYFPHQTEHGATLFILQDKWGNDGFAVWFKLLERLGTSDGHYIDCRNQGTWLHLVAYTRVDTHTLTEMLDLLAGLGKIDPELWKERVIFCQRFVDGITDAYRRRINALPSRDKVIAVTKVVVAVNMPSETPMSGQTDGRSTERERERERKEEKEMSEFEKERLEFFEQLWEVYPKKDGKKAALRHYLASVKTDPDLERINAALGSYLIHVKETDPKFIKNGSTWFHNWEDWEPTDER